ncbi:MAG: hypothetical protein JWM98_159 [Thermoleophilia bacterium]|nr:hypothetical protein [Thermoleophilia bacterium]
MLNPPRASVTGGGAAAVTTGGPLPARTVRSFTFEELAARSDALALRLGARATASAILLACVVVILVGAQSLLSTMEGMDRDIKEMNTQMATANVGIVVLNKTMDSLPGTRKHLTAIVGTVSETSTQVKVSSKSIAGMAATTKGLNGKIGSIATSTTSMRTSLQHTAAGTDKLAGTISELNTGIGPLVETQHSMLLGTKRMVSGIDGMNSSLAYVVRQLNYITAPPTGGGLMMRATMPKETLPPIPGIKAEVAPLNVFQRFVWPVYTGP